MKNLSRAKGIFQKMKNLRLKRVQIVNVLALVNMYVLAVLIE